MNIFYLKNIFYEHSKNEKLNYLQTVKIDSSTHRELQNVVYMKKKSMFKKKGGGSCPQVSVK
jgi:hypothetical protein